MGGKDNTKAGGGQISAAIFSTWRDSTPAVPFSFSYKCKNETITQSPREMRDKLIRDSMSTAIHRTTSHFAPSSNQMAFIEEAIKKEVLIDRRRNSPPRSQKDLLDGTNGSGDNHALSSSGSFFGRSPSNNPSSKQPEELSLPRAATVHKRMRVHQIGRRAYMEERRKLPSLTDEHVPGYLQTSKQYGPSPNDVVVVTNKCNTDADFRRKGMMREVFRTSGVFN